MIHLLGAAVLGFAFTAIARDQHARGKALAAPPPLEGPPRGRIHSHQKLFQQTYSGWGNPMDNPPEPWSPNGYGTPHPRWVYRRGLWEATRGPK